MLEITNLHATVADKPILNGVSLHVVTGEGFKQLPMEFAVEAQKLLGISLEGSVG
jgi:hypothetical protein